MSILAKSFNDRLIRIRQDDRYVSATDMAQACGKQFGHWNSLKSTTEYLQALESAIGIRRAELVEIHMGVEVGGRPENQGTWLHPKVALRFAQWCSPHFAVQVDCWIDELLTTGKVQLESENIQGLQLSNDLLDKKIELLKLQQSMLTMHGAPIVLALAGKEDQIVEVEKPTIEVIDNRYNVRVKGRTATQLADYSNKMFGTKFKKGPGLIRFLEAHGKGHMVAKTLRTVTQDYIPKDFEKEVLQTIKNNTNRQILLGE
jgi:hypothetical protein